MHTTVAKLRAVTCEIGTSNVTVESDIKGLNAASRRTQLNRIYQRNCRNRKLAKEIEEGITRRPRGRPQGRPQRRRRRPRHPSRDKTSAAVVDLHNSNERGLDYGSIVQPTFTLAATTEDHQRQIGTGWQSYLPQRHSTRENRTSTGGIDNIILYPPCRFLIPHLSIYPDSARTRFTQLIEHYAVIGRQIYDEDKYWTPTVAAAITDPIFFHLCAIASAIHLGFTKKNYNFSEFIFHRTRVIELVNHKITHHDQVTDTLLIIVANLVKTECYFGDQHAYLHHLNGLRTMIDLRGGYDALNELLRAQIFGAYLLVSIETKSAVQLHYTDHKGRSTFDILGHRPAANPFIAFMQLLAYFPDDLKLVSVLKFWLILWPDDELRLLLRGQEKSLRDP